MDDIFLPGGAMVPRGVDMQKWSVVACDQYTSEPEYWQRLSEFVGDAPSTINLIVPEVYLNEDGLERRIEAVHAAMERYLSDGLLEDVGDCYILVERILEDGTVRHGLVGRLDLEAYDYSATSRSPVRATEGTVAERIPPRAAVRRGATLDIPHVLLLADDAVCTIVEPTLECMTNENLLYDVQLYGGGGRVRGWRVGGVAALRCTAALRAAAAHSAATGGVVIAVGDGNHSLAAAKTCYIESQRCAAAASVAGATGTGDAASARAASGVGRADALSGADAAVGGIAADQPASPSRYALAELCNLHSPGITFEPIHRVLTGIDAAALRQYITAHTNSLEMLNMHKRLGSASIGIIGAPDSSGDGAFMLVTGEGISVHTTALDSLVVAEVQRLIDAFIAENGGEVDYVHGDAVAQTLGNRPDCAAFLLPSIDKYQLFPTVVRDGALPRKTFSMGHAHDKRYYMECHVIKEQGRD